MAEIFGAVASGAGLVSLSLDLLESAQRLKSLYNRAKNAPVTLLDLTHNLETISLLLQELEKHRQYDTANGELLERCTSQCRQSTDKIRALVDKLERRLQSLSVLGRLSVSLKDSKITQLLSELERAKSSIMLAFQIYSTSRLFRRDEVPMEQLQQMQMQGSTALDRNAHFRSLREQTGLGGIEVAHMSQCSVPIAEKRTPVRPNRRRKRYKTYRMSTKLAWLTGRIWEFAARQAQGGWDFLIRSYNIQPIDAPIFRYCKAGNLEVVRDLLSYGEASLLDCDDRLGDIPLWCAARNGHVDLCRFLLSISDLSDSAIARKAIGMFAFYQSFSRNGDFEEMYRLFLEDFGVDVDLDAELPTGVDLLPYHLAISCPDVNCVDIVQRNQSLPYQSQTPEERFTRAMQLTWPSRPGSPSTVLKWAGLKAPNQDFAAFEFRGTTFLHVVAELIGHSLPSDSLFGERLQWIAFARDLLQAGADPLSHFSGATPFMKLLSSLSFSQWSDAGTFVRAVQTWARILDEACVDLQEYGERECQIWDQIRLQGGEPACSNWMHCSEGLITGRLQWSPDPRGWIVNRPAFRTRPMDCTMYVQRFETLEAFELQSWPGGWPTIPPLAPKICWNPDPVEEEEGQWVQVMSKKLVSPSMDACTLADDWYEYNSIRRVNDSQDDSSLLILRINRRKLARNGRRRGHSQPPVLRQRLSSGLKTTNLEAWSLRYHICPFDGTLRFDCPTANDIIGFIRIRECVKGHSMHEVDAEDRFRRLYWDLVDLRELEDRKGRLPMTD